MDVEFSKEDATSPEIKYEYLDHDGEDDHTVQLHAWGNSLKEAFEQCGVAMFGYMTDLENVTIESCYQIDVRSYDIECLLYDFLDELSQLFMSGIFLICKRLEITKFDLERFELVCRCYGEPFAPEKLPEVTEVKEITSAIQIIQEPERNHYEVFATIDI